MQRLVLGSLLAALVMFTWGAVFWTTPLSESVLATGYEVEAAREALLRDFPESGVYFVPDANHSEETFLRQHLAGPLAMIFLRREGTSPMAPMVFVQGFAHTALSTLLVAFLLRTAAPMLRGYGSRVGFVLLFGIAAAVWGHLGQPVWFYHPWKYHLMVAGYEVVAWLLGGFVLARFVRSEMRFT